ncbi:MAG: ZIP family metal transporter [Candidatus Pacebacteria bacterium]|nr:ZIP family metal transporter [Candidatus Paceibacterota bacterium]
MDQSIIFSFVGIGAVAALSFLGFLFLGLKPEKLKTVIMVLVSFSAGALIGDAFFHLIPETVESAGPKDINAYIYITLGIVIFFVLEKIIHWRHCHIPTSEDHPHELGVMNLVGDGLHNFLDGLIITSAFLVDINLGIATVFAVIAHEIPQKIGDFGILVYAGYSKLRAIWLNLIFSLISFAGGLLALFFAGNPGLLMFLNSFTAGSFIYIAVADLIPEMKKDHSLSNSSIQLLSILLGLGMMLGFKLYLSE